MITQKGKWGVNRAENGQKRCSKCLTAKAVDEFHTDNRRPDKLTRWCSVCASKATKERAQNLATTVVLPESKTCNTCGKTLPANAFFHNSHGRDGLWNKCKGCAGPQRRRHKLRHAYGLTEAEFQALFDQQNGKCAICPAKFSAEVGANVDHAHDTGKVRGLLCSKCNLALGLLSDDPGRADACAKYLRERT